MKIKNQSIKSIKRQLQNLLNAYLTVTNFLLPRGPPRPRGTALGASPSNTNGGILFGLLFFVRVHLRLKRSLF